MSNSTIQAREFLRRYQVLSQNSGYNLVYDTLALIREFIPCWSINVVICRPQTLDLNNVKMDAVPLWFAEHASAATAPLFYCMIDQIDFAKKFMSQAMSNAVSGEPIQAYSFSDHPQYKKGSRFVHYFYNQMNCSDLLVTASLLTRKQFIDSPHTDSYYGMFCSLIRSNGQSFTQDDKDLLALYFDIFIEDFKNKIRSPENSPFLPQITGEIICKKTELEALFDTGKKYSPRELATIKACFDLKQQKRDINRRTVARYLHLQDQDTDEATLKKALTKVDFDINKIKEHLLCDFPPDSPDYTQYKKAFGIEHITHVFQTYAYFGLYPDTAKRHTSYLERRLNKWQHKR